MTLDDHILKNILLRAVLGVKKGALKNFTKFTGNHLCQNLFLIKLQAKDCNYIKKETLI